jgi:hypothetical protein
MQHLDIETGHLACATTENVSGGLVLKAVRLPLQRLPSRSRMDCRTFATIAPSAAR